MFSFQIRNKNHLQYFKRIFKRIFCFQMTPQSLLYFVCVISLIFGTNGQFNRIHLTKLQALDCPEPAITLNIFSGTSNPSWKINREQLLSMKKMANDALLNSNNTTTLNKLTTRVMGYQGFTISCSAEQSVFVHGLYPLEQLLLHGGRRHLSTSIVVHVKSHLGEVMSGLEDLSDDNANCNHVPIRGPDTVPAYDPNTDDNGCFVTKQTENNCYAYGKINEYKIELYNFCVVHRY